MNNVGDNILAGSSNWSFGGGVYKNFDVHIESSIPFYLTGQKIILQISDFFVPNDTLVYDIGCSTGTTLKELATRHENKDVKYIGCDTENEMVKAAKKKCKNFKSISILKDSISTLKLKKSNFIISYYTIQFIHPNIRQGIFNNIYDSLNLGGAFIFFEKVRAPDARFQDISNSVYNEYKLEKGYSAEQILSKSKSLKGILEPFTSEGNIDLANKAGFKNVSSIFKYYCFEGFLAIK